MEIRKKAMQIFTEYLEKNGYRKTPERLALLEKIYSLDGHFCIDFLLEEMEKTNFRVSRATVYNTITLLLDAKLIFRLSLNNTSQYVKAYNAKARQHTICSVCGKVSKFENEAVTELIEASKFPRFTADNYSLYVYGTCSTCKRARTIKMKKQNKNCNK